MSPLFALVDMSSTHLGTKVTSGVMVTGTSEATAGKGGVLCQQHTAITIDKGPTWPRHDGA